MKDQEYLSTFEPDEMSPRHAPLMIQRLVVVALTLSFVASLATCWLNWIIPGSAASWLPSWLILMIENQRIATLLVPLVCLLVCYWVLRTMRGDIMACPERYLDERQKMLREQAHGSAYKLLKRACLLLPLGLLLYTMYWHAPASVPPPTVPSVLYSLADTSQASVLNTLRVSYVQLPAEPAQTLQSTERIATSSPDGDFRISVGMVSFPRTPIQLYEQPESFQWLNSPVSIGTFFGTLLLSLFLMITALPMAVLAWEGRE